MSTEELIALLNALSALWLPLAIVIAAVMFYAPVKKFLGGANRLELGPLAVEKKIEKIAQDARQSLIDTSNLQIVLAESRIVELEHILSLGVLVADEQKDKLRSDLMRIREELDRVRLLRDSLVNENVDN